jgi:hypothetical protein
MKPKHANLLENFDKLPDSAVVPTPVTAQLFGICEKTVRNRFPSVWISPGRMGQRVGYLRSISRGEKTA